MKNVVARSGSDGIKNLVRLAAAVLLSVVGSLAGCRRTAPPPASAKGLPAPTSVAVMAGQLDGSRWLSRDAEVAVGLGANPLQVAVTDIAGDGDRVGGFVTVPVDQCVLAYARGSQGIEDLDLYAYSDDGTTLAADEASDPQPAIVICPPHPTRAYLIARVASGRGVVAIGVHTLAPSTAAHIGKALGARGRPGEELGRIEAWPGLDEKVNQHRRAIGARWEEVRRVAVQADARAPTRISATLDGGRCLDVYVVPGEEFTQLDVVVMDSDERVLLRAPAIGRDRTAIVCSPVQTPLSVELRPHAGQGLCAVMLARSSVGAEREIAGPISYFRVAPSADLSIERAQRAKPLRTLGYSEPTTVGSGTADVGRRLSFPLNLPEGCARIDVIGGRPVAGLTADVWDANNALVASSMSGEGPTLFACGKGGRARIDIEALNRPGPFAIEMRRERVPNAQLVAHPLAASRLLSALNARGESVTVGVASDVRVLALEPTQLRTFDVPLADGRCGDVVAALDAGGTGIDVRLTDGQSGEEFSLSRGRLLAQSRVCAAGRARTLRGEVRLGAGKADALVVLRLTPILPPP
ncbi:MAG TPA: hypothetical protein VK540_09145 [Polyangiaceae bacterium]|nr:hypothetical protein [Polyangiaceae bacterium]